LRGNSRAFAAMALHGISAMQLGIGFCDMPGKRCHLTYAAIGLALSLPTLAQSARAQSVEDLDRLVLANAKPADGLALARSQADSGALLEALATLDRVLTADPKHKQARLLHASILCRLDDPDGAKFEFSRIKSGDYKKADWAAAVAPCNALKATGA
jgi:Tetratricopeptide repeat